MAVGSFGVLSLLVALLSGGANDLLDFVSTDAYWKAKGVTVSVEQLIAELKSPDGADVSDLIKNLGSSNYAKREEAAKNILARGPGAVPSLEKFSDDPDPEIANRVKTLAQQIRLNSKAAGVRKLMAIRTLGEMKKADALPALKSLTDSTEMFVADYASRAIAQIEGKPLPPQAAKPDALKSDLALLPANCAVLGQVSVGRGGKDLSFDEAIKAIPAQPGENRQAMLDQLATQVIQIADQIGNVRIESVTFGVADVVGPQDGFAAVVVRGQYDAQATLALLRNIIPGANNVAGVDVFTPNSNMALAFPGNDRALFMTGASQEKLPVKEMLTAIGNAGNAKTPAAHPLLAQPELAPFVASLDGNARLWAVCKVSDSYRVAPVVQAFDVLTLVGRQEKEGLNLRLAGAGKDAAAVKGAVDMVNQGLDDAKNHLPQMTQQMPMLKPLSDFVAGITCAADGKNATLTGNFKGDASTLLGIPLMMFGVRAEPAQAPAAVQQPQPVQRIK